MKSSLGELVFVSSLFCVLISIIILQNKSGFFATKYEKLIIGRACGLFTVW